MVYSSVATDITEIKLAEEKLKESEEKFRTIAEQSTMGIAILQEDTIKYRNKAISIILGYPMQEVNEWLLEDFFNVIQKEDLSLFLTNLRRRQREFDNEIHHHSCRVITKSRKIKWVEIYSRTIMYQNKEAILTSIIDITEKKEAESELIRLNNLKSELLRRVSHELKTPLISVKGNAELLLNLHYDKYDSDTISIIEEIIEGCGRLEDLIKDLLESAQLESGHIQLKTSKEDLAFLIRFCVKELGALIDNRNHTINLEIHDKLITWFEKEKMYDVITNLLSNAIKYTPQNGNIKIQSEIKENFYVISVKDNGIGFTRAEKKRIFKKFGKIEHYGQGWDLGIEGTGLGLYISKKIIKLHGGEIWVESEGKNKGSTFYFSLPIIKK